MNDALTAKFRQSYPDDAVLPLGLWTIATKNEQNQGVTVHVWVNDIYPWAERNAIHVDGSPFLADGTDVKVTPGYGVVTNFTDGSSLTFTAPEMGEFDGGTYRCGGYELSYEEERGSRVMSEPVVHAGETSCTISQAGDRVWHLTWLWAANSYTLDVAPFVPELGSVACDPEPTAGVYAPDTVVTVTATPSAGYKFVCWAGDVPAGQEKNPTISLTMDASKTCRPVFAGPWTFNGSNQISDSNWTLTVTKNGGELSVTGFSSAFDESMLDLTLPITDAGNGAYAVVSVGGLTGRSIKQLTLPDTLRRIENQAFYNCTALKSVTPLLPSSLVYLGQGCFNGCTALEGDVTFPANTIESPYKWNSVNTSYGWFRASRITSCDMSAATMSTIRSFSFADCTQLESVKLPQGVTEIEQAAFSGATSLAKLEPLFPASVALVGAKAFYNCTALEGDVVFPKKEDGMVTFLEDGNLGAAHFQNCEKITSFAVLCDFSHRYNATDPVDGRLSPNLLNGCKSLESVTLGPNTSNLSATGIFSNCPQLRNIAFLGKSAPTIPASGLFPSVPNYAAIVTIPSLTEDWAAFGATWFSKPTADEKAAYVELTGVVGRPEHIWNDAAKRRLFVRYANPSGLLLIMR